MSSAHPRSALLALAFFFSSVAPADGALHSASGAAQIAPSAGVSRPSPDASPGAEHASFAGTWSTTFGDLTLEQRAERVSGSYAMDGARADLSGSVAGRRLSFEYREVDAHGVGWFELADDGRSFSGSWQEDGQAEWRSWTGERAVPQGFAGLWSTSYGMLRLAEDGSSLRGTYDFAAGSSVVGTLADGRLAFGYAQPDGEVGEGAFTLAADGLSFEGTWRSDDGREGSWSGQRVLPVPGRAWLVILEAHWEASLGAHEYSYGEMLRAFFSRLPDVEVRHRFVHDVADLERFCREAAYLAEPVVLYVSSHGTQEGISLGSQTAGAEALNRALQDVAELRLLHFGSCLVLDGDVPRAIDAARPAHARFPISGFTRSADWAGSAIVDFTYLELVLGRGVPPREALDWTRRMVSFAREDAAEPIAGSGLALYEPAPEAAGVGR